MRFEEKKIWLKVYILYSFGVCDQLKINHTNKIILKLYFYI